MIRLFNFGRSKNREYLEQEINYINEQGVNEKITVEEYINIIQTRTAENFNNPDGLYNLVLEIFDLGLYDEANKALSRLNEIDKRERSINLLVRQKLYDKNYADAVIIYNKFFDSNDDESITYKAYEQLADIYCKINENEKAKSQYLKALEKINTNINYKPLLDKYIQLENKPKIEILDELKARIPHLKLSYMYIDEIYKEILNNNLPLNENRKKIIDNIRESLEEQHYSKESIIKYTDMLFSLNMNAEYRDLILSHSLSISDFQIYKQIIKYYILTNDYNSGFEFIEKILNQNDFSKEELKELLVYEKNLIKIRNEALQTKITMPMFSMIDKPIINKFVKNNLINPYFKESDAKRIYITPISYTGSEKSFEKEYLDYLTSLNLYLYDQIYFKSPYQVKMLLFKNNKTPLISNLNYSDENILSLKEKNKSVDYIIFSQIESLNNNIYNLNVYLYITKKEEKILLNSSILSKTNYMAANNILKNLAKYLPGQKQVFEYFSNIQTLYRECIDYDINFNDNNKYKLVSVSLLLEDLLDIYKKSNSSQSSFIIYYIFSLMQFLAKINISLFNKYKIKMEEEIKFFREHSLEKFM